MADHAVDILKKIADKTHARFIYLLYNLFLLTATPLVALYFLYRARKDPRYARGIRERLGRLPFTPEVTPASPIWFHAVSVGEVLSAVELIRRMRAEYPAAPVYVSVGTVAGRALAEEKLRGLANGVFYAPLDYRRCVRRVLRALRPSLVVILETEIWPNLYREVKRTSAALVVVNGRISDRAFPRYRRVVPLMRAALSWPDAILVQSDRDRERYLRIGAPADRVRAAGNLKYDFQPGEGEVEPVARLLDKAPPDAVWIAASTMPPARPGDVDEDDVVIDAFRQIARPGLLLIQVPRRPERFDVAAAKLQASGIPFVRRSAIDEATELPLPGVLLLDTIGELSRLLARADVVFTGGTLAERGGHNILEPAFFGKPVIVGPHMENFAAIAEEFRAAGAVVEIEAAAQLGPAVRSLLEDAGERDRIGTAARSLAESKRGVATAIARELMARYFATVPCRPRRALLSPLAALWSAGVRHDRERKTAAQTRLSKRVISIGNITMGGAGKTPTAAWLAKNLHDRGLRPAILTRGYRRRSPEAAIVVPAGASAPGEVTGDEAQTFVRAGIADVCIGSNRALAAATAERLTNPDIFLLDDGMQHWALHRDIDIVLVDALDPFAGCFVFPRGRLREPLDALGRASAFVLTRCERGVRTDAIEAVLRRYNAHAPVFRSSVVARRWMSLDGSRESVAEDRPFSSAVAFCGLGNPASFWRTLSSLGVPVRSRWAFDDHHVYRGAELRRLAGRAVRMGATALITTEKDAMNLPEDALDLIAPTPIYYLEIGVEIEDGERLVDLCLGRLTG